MAPVTDELPSNAESGGVQPDQVWADNDRRCAGRTLRVDSVDSVHAYCTVLTNPTETQRLLDRGTIGVRDTRGNKVRILPEPHVAHQHRLPSRHRRQPNGALILWLKG
ncbi:hypothetical protein Misp03_37470 [Microbispora sp. NBRC 16548]|nr:hypothetical protein Misp03_37470 [Microbispora sp. NBRC 16548]